MSTKDLILAIDNGTQSVRALLFDANGQRIARSQIALTYQRPDALTCEQSPEYFWQQVCAACQALWAQNSGYAARIAAVTLTTQRATVVALDAKQQPLRAAISWMDQRRCRTVPSVGGVWPLLFRLDRKSVV